MHSAARGTCSSSWGSSRPRRCCTGWRGSAAASVRRREAAGRRGVQFWRQLPSTHCGEDVLAQLRVMSIHGGCGVLTMGPPPELPTRSRTAARTRLTCCRCRERSADRTRGRRGRRRRRAVGTRRSVVARPFRRRVLVVDSGEHRRTGSSTHGYLGRDPQTPRELLARGREELLAYPSATIVADVVESAQRRPDRAFHVAAGRRQRRPTAGLALRGDRRQADVPHGRTLRRLRLPLPRLYRYEARDRDVVAGMEREPHGFRRDAARPALWVTVATAWGAVPRGRRLPGAADRHASR